MAYNLTTALARIHCRATQYWQRCILQFATMQLLLLLYHFFILIQRKARDFNLHPNSGFSDAAIFNK